MTETIAVKLIIGRSVTLLTHNDELIRVVGNRHIAMLAMLALSADHTLPRRWIQTRLWSSRSPAQAQSSLRQVLFHIRHALGLARDILQSDRSNVWLQPGTVDIFYDFDCAPDDFLCAIHIADSAFSQWLENARTEIIPSLANSVVNAKRDVGMDTNACSATTQRAQGIFSESGATLATTHIKPQDQRIQALEQRVQELENALDGHISMGLQGEN